MQPLWIVIPCKGGERGKSRLSPPLDDEARARLVTALALRTLDVVQKSACAARVLLVSESPALLAEARVRGADALADQGQGLNAALDLAAAHVPPEAALLVLPADLPFLCGADVRALAMVERGCAIAADRAGTGTNALLWRSPRRVFRFGPDSFAAHQACAISLGEDCTLIDRPGLAFDLDEPEDLPALDAP